MNHLLPHQRAQAVSLTAPTAGQLTPAFYGALNRALVTISTQVETLTAVVSTLSDANGDLITVSDLTTNAEELERIVGMQGSGLSVRTPGGYWFGRAITPPVAGLTVSNGGGIGGNPTLVLANDLAALEGLATFGVAVRTAADTWATRTLTGTLNRITVTNGDGVLGAPTFDIAATYVGQTSITTLGTIATGTWQGTIVGLAYGGTGANFTTRVANTVWAGPVSGADAAPAFRALVAADIPALNGLRVFEGANAKQGVATLVAGAVTVSNTSVTANSRIFLTSQEDGGTPGFLRVSGRTAGTSFTITSGSATDSSVVAYEIFEPG